MKYAIRATYVDNVKYASSTKFSKGHFVEDITDSALFDREDNAIATVKALRKNGAEADGCLLDVIGVNFIVAHSTAVDKSEAKSGFILKDTSKPESYAYFYGTKSFKNRQHSWGDTNYFKNIEHATIFSTEKDARARINALVDTAKSYYDFNKQDCARNSQYLPRLSEQIEILNKLEIIKVENI